MKNRPLTRCLKSLPVSMALWLAPALAGAQTMESEWPASGPSLESAADSARGILARFSQARVEKVALLRICLNPVFFPKNEKAEATFAYEEKTREFRKINAEFERRVRAPLDACLISRPAPDCAALEKTFAEAHVPYWRAYLEFSVVQTRAQFLGGIRRVKPFWEREPGDDFERALVGGKDYDLVCQPSPADRL